MGTEHEWRRRNKVAVVGHRRLPDGRAVRAYLDRTNLSVGITAVSRDLGFAGNDFPVISSWALTIFLIGYALANIFGGFITRRLDPKPVVITCFAVWSVATPRDALVDLSRGAHLGHVGNHRQQYALPRGRRHKRYRRRPARRTAAAVVKPAANRLRHPDPGLRLHEPGVSLLGHRYRP